MIPSSFLLLYWRLPTFNLAVSLVLCTQDKEMLLARCLAAISRKTDVTVSSRARSVAALLYPLAYKQRRSCVVYSDMWSGVTDSPETVFHLSIEFQG